MSPSLVASAVLGLMLGAGPWSPTGSLLVPRHNHTATLLPNGEVLVAGGQDAGVEVTLCELYDPSCGAWRATGDLSVATQEAAATLLDDGRVLYAGGVNAGTPIALVELYDPAAGGWTNAGSLAVARYYETVTSLLDGRVLIAGGRKTAPIQIAELFDPTDGGLTQTGPMVEGRYLHTATRLLSGKVLVAGGIDGGTLWSAELYDPRTGSWSPTGSLKVGRDSHVAVLLPSGRVLVAGGKQNNTPQASAELYDPDSGTWTLTGSLTQAREVAAAVVLPSGKVLITGGYTGGAALATAELYDPDSGTWSSAGSMSFARDEHTATLLPSGAVLVAGGIASGQAVSSAELFGADAGADAGSCGSGSADAGTSTDAGSAADAGATPDAGAASDGGPAGVPGAPNGYGLGCAALPGGSLAALVLVLAWALARRRRAGLLGLILICAAARAEPGPQQRPSMAVLDVENTTGEKLDTASLTDLFVEGLDTAHAYRLISSREVGMVLGFERQKQLLGCSDSGCLAELAGAIGADQVARLSVGKVGASYTLTAVVLDARTARVLERRTREVQDPNQLASSAEAIGEQAVRALTHQELPAVATAGARGFSVGPEGMATLAYSPGATAGERATLGGEFGVSVLLAQGWTFGANAVVASTWGMRLNAGYFLFRGAVPLAVLARFTAWPSVATFGGGAALRAELPLTPGWALVAQGAADAYASGGRYSPVSLIANVGGVARF